MPILLILSMRTANASIQADLVAGGLLNPLYVCAPPGDTSRIFVAEQQGKIKIVNIPSGTVNPTPFLDIFFEVAQNQGGGNPRDDLRSGLRDQRPLLRQLDISECRSFR